MKTGFFSKIAAENIRKNRRLYIPRVLTEAGLLGCFYILFTLAQDRRLEETLGGSYVRLFMAMGTIVIGLLSFILIFYINSFLMKQRKSEYGLYNVLGMEKRHIIRVLFHESLITSLLSAALGLCFGMLFYKLCSLLICRLLRAEIVAGFYYLSTMTVLIPAVIFSSLDLAAFLVNSITILRLKPVDLIAEKHTGEKEPRIKWILLILGILTLGTGYYIALAVQSPLEAIFLFFGAVILVIVGTYCLFVTGTTFVLKCLKRNKAYYYDRRHMPAVAGLLFRMKQNAVGLASIAILATGVLVMISTTVSLYGGIRDTMDSNFPQHLYLSAYVTDSEEVTHIPVDELSGIVREAAAENGAEILSIENARVLTVSYLMEDDRLLTKSEAGEGWNISNLTSAMFITRSTYMGLRGSRIGNFSMDRLDLGKDEIAFCRVSTSISNIGNTPRTLTVGGREYRVKTVLPSFPVSTPNSTVVNTIGIVVADDSVLDDIYQAQKKDYGSYRSEYADRIGVTFADEEKISAIGEKFDADVIAKLQERYPRVGYALDTKWDTMHMVVEMNGTLLFLGILLGFVCLFSTILIIYYKQISEGYEDRPRFQIMEKIGMKSGEVKKVISSQLILQFFLPLLTAAVHMAFAFPILLKLLKVLMLTSTQLFVICTVITLAVFALVYTAVYLLTARTYYKIVH